MKKTILPALAMLIVAAVMLSTASYAWFAMSDEVYAENMQVSITSDAANLVIAKTSEAITEDPTYNELKWTIDRGRVELLPTANVGAKSADFASDGIWYTQNSDDPNSSVGTESSKQTIKAADLDGNYALVETFYIGVTAGSNNMYDLQARATIENDDTNDEASIAALRVLVVCTDLESGFQTFSTTVSNYEGAKVLAEEISPERPVEVKVYVYYDGNDTTVNSVNLSAGTIADAKITVYFTASKTASEQSGD